jgi:hypothetical protein
VAVETTADLLDQLRDEIGFDVDGGDATLLGWLNSRHRRMVSRAECYRKAWTVSGGTVAGQADYVLPSDVLAIKALSLDGVPLERTKRADLVAVRSSLAVFVGSGVVVAQGANDAAAETLTIYPTPDVGGSEIEGFGPVRAPELTVSGVAGAGATNSPVVPPEFFEALVHGAASPGMRRTEARHSEADAYDMDFTAATEELRRQSRARWRNGPAQIEVRWP